MGLFDFLKTKPDPAKKPTQQHSEQLIVPNKLERKPDETLDEWLERMEKDQAESDEKFDNKMADLAREHGVQSDEYLDKFIMTKIEVSGVSFNNDDGTSRQSILGKMKLKQKPFDVMTVEVKEYDYKGDPALGVYINDIQIGNVAKEQISHVKKIMAENSNIQSIEVWGGGTTDDGDPKNYGCQITVRTHKSRI